MSGHNKWSQIKHQKGATDKKKSVVFSKILKAITIAARSEPNPAFNPRLRSLIDDAKANAVPNENIERAIRKTEDSDALKELTLEGYGPNGIAMLIETITDSTTRTVNEVRHLLEKNGGKLGEIGSVRWAFEGTTAKFPLEISEADKQVMEKLIELLEDRDDVQCIITNIKK
jgi:YebC/PmpR family DNA-binding regulatory protein